MGERAVKIGKKLEDFGDFFFTGLGWTELARDLEINCHRTSHGKKTHGIDLLFKAINPYSTVNQGIVLECKNRQMASISASNIESWVKELINNIECAQTAPELANLNLDNTSLCTGLLVIHANDTFDANKFYSYLNHINVPRRRAPINIFIASNDQINKWTAVCSKAKNYGEQFSFLYPCINGYNKQLLSSISVNALFSNYIFAQNTYYEDRTTPTGQPYKEPRQENILFFLDEITPSNFKYAWSMFMYYQLQGADRYTFLFFPRKNGDVEFVRENFIPVIREERNSNIDSEMAKIKIEFLDNRDLSPVEIGGV